MAKFPPRLPVPGIAAPLTRSNGPVTPHDPFQDVMGSKNFPQLVGPDGQPLRGKDKDERAVGLAFPHVMGFIARMTGGWGSYWHGRYDQCLKFNREYSSTMRNDGFLSALLWERMMAVYALRHSWHLEIPNENDPFQVRVRDALTAIIRGIVPLGRIFYCLLDAIWFGRQGAQIQWGWTKSPDPQKEKALTVLDWQPLQGDKIGHQFIDIETQHYVEQPYVLVDGGRVGWLKDHGAKLITTTIGWAMVLQGQWRERFIIHKHLVEDADYFKPEAADAVHGVGVRSKIFWANWLKWEWLANITDFFDRVGLGITVWRYPQGNNQALDAIKQAANDQSQRAHIFVPVAEGTEQHQSGIERIEVPQSGADFLRTMIDYIDGIIERYIVGQQASSRSGSSGLGNESASDFQKDTKRNIAIYDADMLAETLTGSAREPGLVNTILKYTYPEADFPVTWRFDQESVESEKKLTSGKTLVDMGVKVKADELRKAGGFSKPIDGDEVAQPPQMPGMPVGTPPGANGASGTTASSGIAQPGEGGLMQQPPQQPQPGMGGAPDTPAPGGGGNTEDIEKPAGKGGPVYLKANTGVSTETGRPLSDSRYVNSETGTVKHFPQAPGEGENGKPVAGQRVVTSEGQNSSQQPIDKNSPTAPSGEGHSPMMPPNQKSATANVTPEQKSLPQETPKIPNEQTGEQKVGREAFQYTDHASMSNQTCAACRFFDNQKSQCHLYEQLNAAYPERFSLAIQVQPTGWCSEWKPTQQ